LPPSLIGLYVCETHSIRTLDCHVAQNPALLTFDHACKISDNLEVGYESYIRFHRRGTANGGMYRIAGLITKQFALGSIFFGTLPKELSSMPILKDQNR
jgi:hypothetical protein